MSNFLYYAELIANEKIQKLSETDLAPKSCRARSSDGLRCCLDAHHRFLNSSHLHRNEDGALISFGVRCSMFGVGRSAFPSYAEKSLVPIFPNRLESATA